MAYSLKELISCVVGVILILFIILIIICSINTWKSDMSKSAKYAMQILIGVAFFTSTYILVTVAKANNKTTGGIISTNFGNTNNNVPAYNAYMPLI